MFEAQLHARLADWQAVLTAQYPKVNWPSVIGNVQHFLETQQRTLVEGLPSMALGVASHAGSVVLALVIAVFVLIDGASMKKAFVSMVPNRHFENAMVMLDRVDRQISSYLIGTAAENALVTVLVAIPLYALGMPTRCSSRCSSASPTSFLRGALHWCSRGPAVLHARPERAVDGVGGVGVRGGALR